MLARRVEEHTEHTYSDSVENYAGQTPHKSSKTVFHGAEQLFDRLRNSSDQVVPFFSKLSLIRVVKIIILDVR